MIQRVSVPVSINYTYDAKKRRAIPRKLLWEGRVYTIKQIGHHHTFRQGRTLFHVFSVDTDTLFFRIVCNTDTLGWTLEEYSDGLPD